MNELVKALIVFAALAFVSIAASAVYDALFDHLPEWYALAPLIFIGLSLVIAIIALFENLIKKREKPKP